MKTKTRISFSLLLVILPVIILIPLSSSCFLKVGSTDNVETSDVHIGLNDENEIKIPKGNEIKIETQKKSANGYLVKVTNVSERKVFCHYQVSLHGDRASMDYSSEKKNPNSKEFEPYNNGRDSLESLKAIESGQSVQFSYAASEKGEYRLNITYLIDENIAEVLASKNYFELNESESEMRSKSERRMQTPIMLITVNK
jgi:hypothetical protein